MKRMMAAWLIGLSLCYVVVASAAESSKLEERVSAARDVLRELMQTPDKGVPLDITAKAHCVVVIPGLKKGAFLVGAEYGRGVATCRTATGWSAPVFVQVTGASFGLQAGGASTDLVLVGLNERSLQDLLKAKVKLGGEAAVAAGPVGRESQAATTELLNAEFLTYSRSKGLFAGIDLSGDEVHQNADDTQAFYGKYIPYREILTGQVPVPPSATGFVATVNEMFHRARARKGSHATSQ
jgi:lipid-binding SYLF domain-containing protein